MIPGAPRRVQAEFVKAHSEHGGVRLWDGLRGRELTHQVATDVAEGSTVYGIFTRQHARGPTGCRLDGAFVAPIPSPRPSDAAWTVRLSHPFRLRVTLTTRRWARRGCPDAHRTEAAGQRRVICCFVVVARGGVEPPTFRFSAAHIAAGQRPFSLARAMSRATNVGILGRFLQPWRSGARARWRTARVLQWANGLSVRGGVPRGRGGARTRSAAAVIKRRCRPRARSCAAASPSPRSRSRDSLALVLLVGRDGLA